MRTVQKKGEVFVSKLEFQDFLNFYFVHKPFFFYFLRKNNSTKKSYRSTCTKLRENLEENLQKNFLKCKKIYTVK